MTFPQGPYYEGEKIIYISREELDSVRKKQACKALGELTSHSAKLSTPQFYSQIWRFRPTKNKQSRKQEKVAKCLQKVSRSGKWGPKKITSNSDTIERQVNVVLPMKMQVAVFWTNLNDLRQQSLTFQIIVVSRRIRRMSSMTYACQHLSWQQFPREHGITGNLLKHQELIQSDWMVNQKQCPQVRRRRLLGEEILFPSTPTPDVIKNEWKKLIDDGEMSPCVPYNMVWYATKDGELVMFPNMSLQNLYWYKREKLAHGPYYFGHFWQV